MTPSPAQQSADLVEPAELVSPVELDAIAQVDFLTFVELVFAELNPGTPFEPGWHLELLAAECQAIAEGLHKRVVVNMPPRSLKSIMMSIALPAWLLGLHPTYKILVVSYGQDLADELARMSLQVMQSPWYRRMFPASALSSRAAAADFKTPQGGGRLASSFGGAITGRGFDLIIVDDPIKPDEALSDKVRNGVNDYVATTLRSRFNSQAQGAILVVMQRLHEDDLCGHLLQKTGWRHVCLPAIAEQDEVWTYSTPFGPRTATRQAGQALQPSRDSLEVLEDIRRDVGAYVFAAQYQQRPAPLDGGVVTLGMFGRYLITEPPTLDELIQSWDTAGKTAEANDYSVCTTWGRKGRHVYLLAVHRRKMEYPKLKQHLLELRAEWRPARILIEDVASGESLISDLKHDGVCEIRAIKPKVSKGMRLAAVSSMIEAGHVMLPREAPWLAALEHELMVFPNGRHDDQVDSLTQALGWFIGPGREDGWLQMAMEEIREHNEQRGLIIRDGVRLKGPPDIIYHSGSGRDYIVGEDGEVTMSPSDAKIALESGGWSKATEDA